MPSQEALLGHFDQLFCLIADLTAGIGGGTVAVEAADESTYVYADDVALLQLPGTGDAVDHLVVHRDAGRTGKTAVAQKRGLGPVALDKAADRCIDLMGSDAGCHHGTSQGPGLGGDPPGPAHGLDLPGRFNGNQFYAFHAFSASMMTSVVPSIVG